MYDNTFEIGELEELGLQTKIQSYSAKYLETGKVPGITVSEAMIQKTLKDLGVKQAAT